MFIFGYVSVCDCVFVPKSNWSEVCAKTDKWLGNGTFVCVSVCPCVFVCVSGISSVLN